jgi:hypothetical protein
MYGAKLVEARQKPNTVHTAACSIFSPECLQSRNTATASSRARDAVTVTVKVDHPLSVFVRLFFRRLFPECHPLRRLHRARAAHFSHRELVQ